MNDLECIEKHMRERFYSPDPFVMGHVAKLEGENAHLRHRIMVLETEICARNAANIELNRRLLELLREECSSRSGESGK